MAVIVVAGVVAGLETNAALMQTHGATLLALDKIIVGIFIGEAGLKMAAAGWNVFDFLIVVLCVWPIRTAVSQLVIHLARTGQKLFTRGLLHFSQPLERSVA